MPLRYEQKAGSDAQKREINVSFVISANARITMTGISDRIRNVHLFLLFYYVSFTYKICYSEDLADREAKIRVVHQALSADNSFSSWQVSSSSGKTGPQETIFGLAFA